MGIMKKKIPYEVKAYKSTMFFGFTTRQVICLVIMLALAVPTYIFGSKFMTSDTLGYVIMVEVVTLAAVGWLSYNDMPMEQIATKVFFFYTGCQKRKWQFTNTETKLHELAVKELLEKTTEERKQELADMKAAETAEKAKRKAEEKQRRIEMKKAKKQGKRRLKNAD